MAKMLYWVGSTGPVESYGRILNWGDEIDESLVNDDDDRWRKTPPTPLVAKGKAAATDTDEEVTTP